MDLALEGTHPGSERSTGSFSRTTSLDTVFAGESPDKGQDTKFARQYPPGLSSSDGLLLSGSASRPPARFPQTHNTVDEHVDSAHLDPPFHERSFPWDEQPSFEPFGSGDTSFEQDARTFYDRFLDFDNDNASSARVPESRPGHADFQTSGSASPTSIGAHDASDNLFGSLTFNQPGSDAVDVFPARGNQQPLPVFSAKPPQEEQVKPTRIILIEGLPGQVSADTIGQIVSMYGTVRRLYRPRQWPGTAIIVFYDMRHGETCFNEFPSHWQTLIAGTPGLTNVKLSFGEPSILASFIKADQEEIQSIMENEGVVYVQEDAASFLRLQALLGEFGEIRSFVREEDSWTAIEFFDTRAADACHPALMRVGLRMSYKKRNSSVAGQKSWFEDLSASLPAVPERPPLRHSLSFSDGFSSMSQQRVGLTKNSRDLQRAIFERRENVEQDVAVAASKQRDTATPNSPTRSPAAPAPFAPALERSMSYSGESIRDTTSSNDGIDALGKTLNDPFRSIAKFLGPDIDPRKLKAPPATPTSANNHYPVMQGRKSPPSKLATAAESNANVLRTIPVSNVVDMWSLVEGRENRTTIMIRNVPNKYTQSQFLDLLNETHAGEYSFVYLRIDYVNKCNTGYAFVDFPNPASIVTFAHRIVGKKWPLYQSDKLATVSWANVQGKASLIEKFRNSQVMIEDIPAEYKPKLFHTEGPLKGQEEPFPPPTIGTPQQQQRTLSNVASSDFEEDEYDSVFSFNNLRVNNNHHNNEI